MHDRKEILKSEDIEQILAEADDLLRKLDPDIMEHIEEEQRALIKQQAQSLKTLKYEVKDKLLAEEPSPSTNYSDGIHEAIEDIVKAMKRLGNFLS